MGLAVSAGRGAAVPPVCPVGVGGSGGWLPASLGRCGRFGGNGLSGTDNGLGLGAGLAAGAGLGAGLATGAGLGAG